MRVCLCSFHQNSVSLYGDKKRGVPYCLVRCCVDEMEKHCLTTVVNACRQLSLPYEKNAVFSCLPSSQRLCNSVFVHNLVWRSIFAFMCNFMWLGISASVTLCTRTTCMAFVEVEQQAVSGHLPSLPRLVIAHA